MSETTDIIQATASVAAILISLFAIWSSRKSEGFAKISAESAKASAEASKLIANVSQFGELSPHFENIQHFINALMGEENINVPKVEIIRQSIRSLSAAFTDDKKFSEILSLLTIVIDDQSFKNQMHIFRDGSTRINIKEFCPAHLPQLLPTFLQKKSDCLKINQ